MELLALISLVGGAVLTAFGFQGFLKDEYYLVRKYAPGREAFARRVALMRLVFGLLELVCAPVILLAPAPYCAVAFAPFVLGCSVIKLYQKLSK